MSYKHHGDRVMTKDAEKLPVIRPDEGIENADWTKQSWDLPPYKSPQFMTLVSDLDHFRTTPVYKHAVNNGLIYDDEWVADHATPV